jgi:pimeloyl-ACP methyl ester carboxylesterase
LQAGKEMTQFKEINITGQQLAVVSTNSKTGGMPVIFLHGIGSCLYFWTPEETTLFDQVGPCYSLSLPGHYPARFPQGFAAESLTAGLMAELLAGAIREIVGEQKVLLVGHSTGGFAALSLAIHAPGLVAGVISIAGFARGQWTGALGFSQWLTRQGPPGRALFKLIYAAGGLHPEIYRALWLVHAHDRKALLAYPGFARVITDSFPYTRRLDLESMLSYFARMPHIDIGPELSKISVPVCLITGDHDPTVPPAESQAIAKKVACAELTVIQGAGHLALFEKSLEYKHSVETWLAKFQSVI